MTVVVALLVGACSGSSGSGSAGPAGSATVNLAGAGVAPFHAGGSVGQVYVTGADRR